MVQSGIDYFTAPTKFVGSCKNGGFMKRISIKSFLALLLISATLLASSCSVMDLGAAGGAQSSGGGANGNYITRADVEEMIAGIDKNINVDGGDSYDINIESNADTNLLAASRGLLSAVSVISHFKITRSYGGSIWSPPSTATQDESSAGAGVIYKLDKNTGDAYIITNHHVVYYEGSDSADDISDNIEIYIYGKEYADYKIPATYVGGSATYDIAVLKVTESAILRESFATEATFANSNDVSVLETVIAIGNPASSGISATVGCVNVDSEEITIENKVLRVMRIDAAVNGGNSGGGLFNTKGEVVGIVNAKITSTSIDNIGYAIPSNIAKYVADNIIYYDAQNPENDSVFRLLLGIQVAIKDSSAVYDAETGKVHTKEIVKIAAVNEGVAQGKLMVDDVIKSISIDGTVYEVTRTFNVVDAMLTARNTSSVVLNVVRGGADMSVTIDMSGVTPTPA